MSNKFIVLECLFIRSGFRGLGVGKKEPTKGLEVVKDNFQSASKAPTDV